MTALQYTPFILAAIAGPTTLFASVWGQRARIAEILERNRHEI